MSPMLRISAMGSRLLVSALLELGTSALMLVLSCSGFGPREHGGFPACPSPQREPYLVPTHPPFCKRLGVRGPPKCWPSGEAAMAHKATSQPNDYLKLHCPFSSGSISAYLPWVHMMFPQQRYLLRNFAVGVPRHLRRRIRSGALSAAPAGPLDAWFGV